MTATLETTEAPSLLNVGQEQGEREDAIRADLWARRLVWQQQQQQHKEKTIQKEEVPEVPECPPLIKKTVKKENVRHYTNKETTFKKSEITQKLPKGILGKKTRTEQSQVAQMKKSSAAVSKLLPMRLGLGKVADVGGGEVKGHTRFAAAYKSGAIQRWLRVDQNGSRPDVAFASPVATIPINVVLPLCFEGLRECTHPLCLLARRGAQRLLLEHPRASAEVPSFLSTLIPPLRLALASKNRHVTNAAITQVGNLAKIAGPALLDHLDKILLPLGRHAFGSPLSKRVQHTLHEIESNIPDSRPKIKAKIPSYE
uniref:Uncharacterized protein n=1 Tax=Aureoumbra lagunensis TaxID=44058 RepID=A0A7S3JSX6_9STRA|mmetsp:Transcript_13631/g.20328  ORF Transcript_13631/g.20328 Transcript_13631/m.20328 type:complete len:313 (-) Transcript_13631:5-943(-)